MKQTRREVKRRPASRTLLVGYGLLMVVGYLLGWGAAPDNEKAGDPKEEAIEEVIRAVNEAMKAVKKGPQTEPDGGVPERESRAGDKKRPAKYIPSAEPASLQDAGLPDYRRLPEPDKEGGQSKRVVIIEVHDIIDMGLSAFIERSISENKDAAALILDINTPGGRVDAATVIRDAIINAPKSMRTVAFIHPRAISAGAFISFACDLIFIADGGSMGAATPISIGGGGEATPVDEKMVSYFRTEMATTARAKGRRGDIAEAMVDSAVEIKGLTQAGKLLTLDTAGALKWKVADAKANSIDEVLALLALGSAKQERVTLNWAEELARIFTHPILSSILMSVGVLGILIELYHPGFGLPGIVGISCLIIFFAGHLVVNLAGWEEVMLFVLGVGLLAVELFVTPGFGVMGAAGILSILISLVLSLSSLPVDISFSTGVLINSVLRVVLSIGIAIVLFFVAFAFLPRVKFKTPLILEAAIQATAAGGREGEAVAQIVSSGETGVAESFLRPAGIARFGERRVDVVSEGDFIEKGAEICIVRVSGNRVVVRRKG
jgi:membrane-bound serine protease (ClpP class)